METSTLQPVQTLKGHWSWIRTVASLDSENIITASEDQTVRLWSLFDGRCLRNFSDYDAPVRDIAVVDESTVVTISVNTLQILRVTDGRVLGVCSSFSNELWSCAALDATTAIVGDRYGKLYKIEWREKGKFFKIGRSENNNIVEIKQKTKAHKDAIQQIFVLGDKFATCSEDASVKLWNASSMSLLRTFHGHNDRVECVAFDKKHLVTWCTDKVMRVYDARTAYLIAGITTHSDAVTFIRIAQEGNIIVTGGADKIIALYALPSCECIAKYDVDIKISSGTLLDSGLIVVASHNNYDVVVFEVDLLRDSQSPLPIIQQPTTPKKVVAIPTPRESSVLEQAFNAVLSDIWCLTPEFILDTIRAENVLSATDLYCGHNIVLLAIRCGVITAADVHKFNGSLWFFEENLYYPGCKLIHECPIMLYSIFHHAQDVGIIRDGHKFRCEHENRVDTEAKFESIQLSLDALHARLSILDERVSYIADEVEVNARNFQYLFESIKKKEKYMQYAAFAKILLSLIPLLGKAIGDTAYTGVEILFNLSVDDIVETGLELGKTGLEEGMGVDLSNAQVAYSILSKRKMNMMNEEARTIITNAVSRSEFGTMDGLRNSLEGLIQNGALEQKFVAMLDIGSSEWLENDSTSKQTERKVQDQVSAVRHLFKSFAIGRGKTHLSITEATSALNIVFTILDFSGFKKKFSAIEFETELLKLSKEIEVSEDVFVDVFHAFMVDIRTSDEGYLSGVYGKVFDRTNGKRKTTGIEFAAHTLQHAYEELKEKQLDDENALSDIDISVRMMACFDTDGDGKVNRKEFVSAALSILHGIVKK